MATFPNVITTSRQFHVPRVTDHQRVIVAEAIKQGVTQAGGTAPIFQYDLLSPNIPLCPVIKRSIDPASRIPGTTATTYPTLTPTELVNFDAFLFGIPTRFGNFPAEWKVRYPSWSDLPRCRALLADPVLHF
jgi:multimeric flavodoxin WrbA